MLLLEGDERAMRLVEVGEVDGDVGPVAPHEFEEEDRGAADDAEACLRLGRGIFGAALLDGRHVGATGATGARTREEEEVALLSDERKETE